MSDTLDLLIINGRVMTPGGLVEADIGIAGGKIVSIGALSGGAAAETFDAKGLHVLPGVIDSQVHFREPGLEHKEDIAHGTKAAIKGGVTSIFEMPNTSPLTLDAATLQQKLDIAAETAWSDHAFFMGGNHENADQLSVLEKLPGCAGVKIFMGSSTGTLLAKDDDVIAAVLANGNRRVSVHAEDEDRLISRQGIATDAESAEAHPDWRDVESAVRATKRIVKLARDAGRRVHVLHISSADEMDILAEHKDLITVEVTLNHLTMAAPECYERLGAFAQMNPPVRDASHREGLWAAVRNGIVDVFGSDHAPHTIEEKERPYPSSPSGMPGVQTSLPLLLDHMNAGRLSLERLVDLTSHGPQRIFNIAGKGRIAVGYDADLVLVDLAAKREITDEWIASKCGWTPFDGVKVTGWPMATILRGKIVVRDDEVLGEPSGKPVRFVDIMEPA
ncbi:MAG: dihydroorotase [Alphaproteobacteria bacterium]|nr:dihydroorotase [Alphaproteobacteria bacterium]